MEDSYNIHSEACQYSSKNETQNISEQIRRTTSLPTPRNSIDDLGITKGKD